MRRYPRRFAAYLIDGVRRLDVGRQLRGIWSTGIRPGGDRDSTHVALPARHEDVGSSAERVVTMADDFVPRRASAHAERTIEVPRWRRRPKSTIHLAAGRSVLWPRRRSAVLARRRGRTVLVQIRMVARARRGRVVRDVEGRCVDAAPILNYGSG